MDEVGIRLFGPVPRRRIELVREDADGNRNLDALGNEEGELVLPVEARCRDAGVGQPEQRDVVEDIVRRKAFGLPVERTRDHCQAARVVVEHVGRKGDRRVRQARQRLRARSHQEGVVNLRVEEDEPFVDAAFLIGETGRRRRPDERCVVDLDRDCAGHVGVDAEQFRRRLHADHVGDDRAPVAALRGELLVAEAPHQRDPGAGDALGAPAGRGRLAGEAVAGHRRDHQMEGVRGAAAMGGRVGQRSDDLELLDDRTRPAMRHDQAAAHFHAWSGRG